MADRRCLGPPGLSGPSRDVSPAGLAADRPRPGADRRGDSAAADRAIERSAWPRRVTAGLAGLSSIDPVADANVLLTDGRVTGRTAGYAYDHVAAVPGARFLAEMPRNGMAFDYSVPAAVAQLLLHEVGHALGLDHGHGAVTRDGRRVTVSPMIGGYAWTAGRARRPRICGDDPAAIDGLERRVSLRYSPCGEAALGSYRGGLPV